MHSRIEIDIISVKSISDACRGYEKKNALSVLLLRIKTKNIINAVSKFEFIKKLHIQFQFIYISHETERFKEIKIVRIYHFSFESEIYCEVKQLKG